MSIIVTARQRGAEEEYTSLMREILYSALLQKKTLQELSDLP